MRFRDFYYMSYIQFRGLREFWDRCRLGNYQPSELHQKEFAFAKKGDFDFWVRKCVAYHLPDKTLRIECVYGDVFALIDVHGNVTLDDPSDRISTYDYMNDIVDLLSEVRAELEKTSE